MTISKIYNLNNKILKMLKIKFINKIKCYNLKFKLNKNLKTFKNKNKNLKFKINKIFNKKRIKNWLKMQRSKKKNN